MHQKTLGGGKLPWQDRELRIETSENIEKATAVNVFRFSCLIAVCGPI